MSFMEEILKHDPLMRKMKDSIDNKQDLTLSYEELIDIFSSCLIGLARDKILEEVLNDRYKW